MSKLFVRHNEQGSLSIRSEDEHKTYRLIHQSQLGSIMSETEISLQPHEALHLIQLVNPEPEDCP